MPNPPVKMVDMTGSLPVPHFLATTAAVRYLLEDVLAWEDSDLPEWLHVNCDEDARNLQGYLEAVCNSLEPTARKLAAEGPGADAAPPKLELVKGRENESEG